MRLFEFRVRNYKKVRDTGWVTCRDLTVFVGKNEAGKSAAFRGLSKLNPSDGQKYDGLKEFPRRRFTDEFKSEDWPVASVRFLLAPEERTALSGVCPALDRVEKVVCTRHYSWKLTVDFEPVPAVSPATRQEFVAALQRALQRVREWTAPEGKGEALGTLKTALVAGLEPIQKTQEAQPGDQRLPKAEADQVVNTLAGQANERWQKRLIDPVARPLRDIAERTALDEKLAVARKWVEQHIPQFVYFDRYDVIDSAVHLPTFVQQLASSPTAPKVRTTRCLFEHVGLEVPRLAALGRHQPTAANDENIRRLVDERAIHFSSASNAMTQKFTDWYEQRKHKFRYQADGDYFRVWVSDDLDPSEIELDQRSVGMQYFFSFFIVFLVEAQGAHRNSILLLDEPGLHMHGTAQAKIVEFLEKLSVDNQTLYTTHSPFLISGDHLERARAVYEGEDGTTRISEDVWPRDRDSLFPLQAALGYQLVQSLFIAKRQVLVEGISDFWILKALDVTLGARSMPTLRPDIKLVPSAGVSKLLPLASLLTGHDVALAALLDGDEPGRREGKKLVEKLLAGEDRKCLFIGDFIDKPEAEIEDVFPEEEYFAAVREAYGGMSLDFTKAEKSLVGVVNKVEALFKRKGMPFAKWKPAAVLRDGILAAPDQVAASTCDAVGRMFEALNSLFPAEDVK